eukprot:TRINITY_DN65184_c0_g1_i1.p1 TRINITY_DN65184_c0_g1~~TRINITY_DN65184_c0_g1_i1.p1  ORF type:complete len:646 (+),score=123.70 TRINITY_DN65184_c0_g1_i1:74-2011(+)
MCGRRLWLMTPLLAVLQLTFLSEGGLAQAPLPRRLWQQSVEPSLLKEQTFYLLVKAPAAEAYMCLRLKPGRSVEAMFAGVRGAPDFNNDVCKLLWQNGEEIGSFRDDADSAQLHDVSDASGLGLEDCQSPMLHLGLAADEAAEELQGVLSSSEHCSLSLAVSGSRRAFGLQNLHTPQALSPQSSAAAPAGQSQSQGKVAYQGEEGLLENVRNRGRCIGVGADGMLYTLICAWGSPVQRWKLRADHLIESVHRPGQCIDVAASRGGSQSAQRLQLASCEVSPAGNSEQEQAWRLRSDGLLGSQLRPGKCIDAQGDPAGWYDAPLQLWDCEEDAVGKESDQRWMIAQQAGEPEPDSVLASLSKSSSASGDSASPSPASGQQPTAAVVDLGAAPRACFLENVLKRGLCADVQPKGAWVPAALKFEGEELHLLPCAWGQVSTESRWKFRPDGFIESVHESGKCIDVRGNPGGQNGDLAQLRECEFAWPVTDQRWTLRKDGLIENQLHKGKCLDVDGYNGYVPANAKLQIWDCEAAAAKSDQRWLCTQEPNQPLPPALLAAQQQAEEAAAVAAQGGLSGVAQKYAVTDSGAPVWPVAARRWSVGVTSWPPVVLGGVMSLGCLALSAWRLRLEPGQERPADVEALSLLLPA